MPFSILAWVSSQDSHIGLEAEGRYGSRDDTWANMEKTCYNLFITYLSMQKREKKRSIITI